MGGLPRKGIIMFTKEYVREVLEQMCAPYMEVPLSEEFVNRIYDGFVKIRNEEAAQPSAQADAGNAPGSMTFAMLGKHSGWAGSGKLRRR
jgi:Lhr-like helicase